MSLPDVIPVRYTEEEAGYVSFRPVVRQSFRPDQLLDMVLSVTGKDAARIKQILRSGTVVFHFYRYWWQGFDIDQSELAGLLARFPDPDPSREFRAAECTMIAIESGATPPRPTIEVAKEAISHSGLFRRRNFWDGLLAEVACSSVAYQGYSFGHRADLYRLELTDAARTRLAAAVASLDLVITVDTSMPHLVGAMAKPCWAMISTAREWRWGGQEATSPWYPSLRLFRQSQAGEWSGVLEAIAAALRSDFLRPER